MKRVVLVRTAGPRNAGAVLRAVANFGPAELWFVAPARPALLLHPEFEQMAHGVERARERIRVAARLEDALADCQRSIGFTARVRGSRVRRDWLAARDEVRAADAAGQAVALVFGSEESGLTVQEAEQLGELCYLSTSGEHTSINLALAAGIVLWSLFSGENVHGREEGARLITGSERTYLKEHLKTVLRDRVARTPPAKHAIEGAIERIFTRAPIESRDARAWHMMMRALGSRETPPDYGIEQVERRLRRKQAVQRARRREESRELPPPAPAP